MQRKYKLVQKLEGSTQKSLDEEVTKPIEESHSQLPDSQLSKATVAEDENDRLKVFETSKEGARRASTENSSSNSLSLTEKDTVDKSTKVSTDTTDSKTEPSLVTAEKPEEQGIYI